MAGPGILAGLRHRDFALFISGFTAASIGSWAYNVALVVWLIDETGSPGWVAAATAGRFIPALLFSAYGGVVAERFERVRLMVSLDLAAASVMVCLSVEMAAGAPPWAVVATAALATTVGIAYEPAAAALTPQLVGERDLGSANALRNTIDNVCVIAGPGLGALLLVLGEPWVAVAVNAGTYVVSAACTGAIKTRSTPVDVTEGGEVGPLRQMLVGITAINSSASTATLTAFCVIATMVYGIDSVLFVLVSEDVLGTGAEGYGYLLAGLGVGGVLAAPLVPRLERLPRLGLVIWLGMAAYCLPTLLFLVVDQPVAGFVIQVVRGASTLVVDVLAITALQRTLPSDVLARVFGAFNGLLMIAVLIGSALVTPVVNALGLDAVFWVSGLAVPLLCLLAWPWLRRMDAELAARRAELAPKLALLGACDLFSQVGEGPLDQLAGSAVFADVVAGQTMVAQGAAADSFYVIESGEFHVSAVGSDGAATELPQMTAGAYFGEIGLIESIPRTATVTAATDGRLLRVDGAAFVDALTHDAPSAALLDGAALRLGRTSQSRSLSRAGLSESAD